MVLHIDLFDILLLLLIFHAVRKKKKKLLELIDVYICIRTMYIQVISQDITGIQMLGFSFNIVIYQLNPKYIFSSPGRAITL